jgi:UDPglucose 6-dehydrogenase
MKIAVIGTGYVGLVTGTCFAETGNDVICVDIDKNKVDKLSSGQITIYEPGLEKIFLRNQKENRLHFTTSLVDGIKTHKLFFLPYPHLLVKMAVQTLNIFLVLQRISVH